MGQRLQTRLALAWLAMSLLACDARANQPPPVPPPVAPPEPRSFNPRVISLPERDPVMQALTALDNGEAEAALGVAQAALADAAEPRLGRLRWLMARAATAADRPQDALALLGALAESAHPLAPWARVRHAELVEEEDPQRAAELMADQTSGWGGAERARRIEARSLGRCGQQDAAIPKLRALVAAAPDHVGAASSAVPLARILAAQPDIAAQEEAITLYRRVASRAPLARVGQESEREAARLVRLLPAERRNALSTFSPEEEFARASAFMQSRRYERAQEAFQQLAARVPPTSALHCEALLNQGRAMLRRRAREEGAHHMDRVAERCTDGAVVAAALYNAARAHGRRGRPAEAISRYDQLAARFSDNSLADDALYRAALAANGELGLEAMAQRLAVIPERFPDGDMRTKAVFKLAWLHFEAGRFDEAQTILDASFERGPLEETEGIRGRVAYWRARTMAARGDTDSATQAYADLFRQWPLSYYAQQAHARINELRPDLGRALVTELSSEAPASLTFPWRSEFDEPGFVRAIELFTLGEKELGRSELDELGFSSNGADPDLLWVTASLLHEAGALPASSRLVRTRLSSFHGTMPTGRDRALWRLAYPRAFSPLLDDVSREAGVPATFVRAVAREESAFNPRAVSVANAYGLIQLIAPTARRFARPLGLPSDRQSLFEPGINLRIGSRYIAFLRGTYPSTPALVPAAYNAGHGAVNRWLRVRGSQPLDQFIENIPYDETRRYSRRVLQTYGVYSWLDDRELPTLGPALPNQGGASPESHAP